MSDEKSRELDDTDRQLRAIRQRAEEQQSQIADRLNVANERIEVMVNANSETVREVRKLSDLIAQTDHRVDVLVGKVDGEAKLRMDVIADRVEAIRKRIAATDAAIARIEDMLTAERTITDPGHSMAYSPVKLTNCTAGPAKPIPRKSLGWINIWSDIGAGLIHPDRATANMQLASGLGRRLACIEVFEGDGL